MIGDDQIWPNPARAGVKFRLNSKCIKCLFQILNGKTLKQSVEGILVGVFINLALRLGYASYF